MAITSASTPQEVLDQYNNSLAWETSLTTAQNALYAIRWMLVNRPQIMSVAGKNINFQDLEQTVKKIETFLGAAVPRSLGRSRINRVDFQEPGDVD